MQSSSFESITAEILEILCKENRNAKTLAHYRQQWSHLKRFMTIHNEAHLTCEVCDKFLLQTIGNKDITTLLNREKRKVSIISLLKDYIRHGKIKPRKMIVNFNGEIGAIIKDYISSRRKERLSNLTINTLEQSLFLFLEFLKSENINSLNDITISHITTHIINVGSKYKSLSVAFFYHGRHFFRYLYQNRLIDKDLSELIPKYKYDSRSKLPSAYSANEVKKVINSVDRSNNLGKRNYAILLLLSLLGLRASDVSKLKFSNINWDNNTIKILQFKTNRELDLPLLPEIGNAIIDYLKHSRAKSDSQYVFLKVHSPFTSITSAGITQVANKYFIKAEVDIRGKHHCSHALRHSLATILLEENIKLPIISEILGHTNSSSTMHYLRVDITSLRRCTLEVPMVEQGFYSQKGGYFYEV